MKTTVAGRRAEEAVAKRLQDEGWQIIAQNWKTAVCEIDIVARKDSVVGFFEVKYRSSPAQGGGLEYIGPKKLSRMNFAARVWSQHHDWSGDYRLMAVEVSGLQFESIQIIEIA